MFAYQIRNGEKKRRQRSPLEENVWLMPAGCTDVKSPEFDPNTHTCHYDGNEWIVTAIPDPVPEPIPDPISAMEQMRTQRNQLLQQTDWRMTTDYPYADQAEWASYRTQLRDLPEHTSPTLDEQGNLMNVEWPTAPSSR